MEDSKESQNQVEESSGEKRVEIEKNQPTPPDKEVIEEVEKEEPYVAPPPYNPLITFPPRFVEAKVDSQSKRYLEVLENIHTNSPLYEVLHKKRKLEDHETREIISVKRGRLAFEVVDKRIKLKPEKLILIIEQKPSHKFRIMNHPIEGRK